MAEAAQDVHRRSIDMSVTIKDVAKLAGVSASTVTRTCQDHPAISQETKKKVREAMSALGYVSSYAQKETAADQRQDWPRSIGVALPPFTGRDIYENSFFLEAIGGISQACAQYGCTISLAIGSSEEELIQNARLLIDSGRADGFVVLYSRDHDAFIDYLHSRRMLYVLIGKVSTYPNDTVYVDNDNLMAAREATDYLLALGHRRIAFLGGESSYLFNQDRYAGYIQSLLQHQIEFKPIYSFTMESVTDPTAAGTLRSILTGEDAPTAILVSDDMMVIKLIRLLGQWGIQVPAQLSVITFNNSFVAVNSVPPLTAVDINPGQLGMEAARQLFLHLDTPAKLATKIIVPHKLIHRESCGAVDR